MNQKLTQTWAHLKSHYYKKPLGISTSKEFDRNKFYSHLTLVIGTLAVVFILGMFVNNSLLSEDESSPQSDAVDDIAHGEIREGLLVLSFVKENNNNSASKGKLIAHKGTLVKVRLLNKLEAFDSVPVFAQITSHALGSKYFGAALIGTASGDGSVGRIKMTFSSLKPKNTSIAPFDFEGQALSHDGTLGVRATKLEGFGSRALITGSQDLLSSDLSTGKQGGLAGLLAKALVKGLQQESSKNLDTFSKSASVLSLPAGTKFYVQLTESIFEGGVR